MVDNNAMNRSRGPRAALEWTISSRDSVIADVSLPTRLGRCDRRAQGVQDRGGLGWWRAVVCDGWWLVGEFESD